MGELEGRTCCAVCFLSMPSLCVVVGAYSSQPEEAASFHYLVCLMPWRRHSFSLLAGTDTIFLINSERLSLYDTRWMTNVFGMCSLGSVELFKAGCSGKCAPQSFTVSAGCLLKCLRGSALFILTCVNLTALSWNGNLKPTTYIFYSVLYCIKNNLKLWNASWRAVLRKGSKGIPCPLGSLAWWQLWCEMRHGCMALVSSDRKKQLNFNCTFHTENKYLKGNNPVNSQLLFK